MYELSGPLLTQEELADTLGDVLVKDIPLQQVSDEKYAEIMKSLVLPDFVIPIVVGIQGSIRNGSLEVESNDSEKILGRPVTPMKEALTQIVNDISQHSNKHP